MIHRLMPLALATIVVGCGLGGTPRLEDPQEILTKSVEAMADVESVRFAVAVDGTLEVAEMGGSLTIDGTELTGSMAMDGSAGQFAFEVPALFGLSGEMRIIGEEAFIKSSMTGPMWMRQEIPSDEADPLAQAADPQAALAEVKKFLAKDGVELTKLEDVECGDERSCYHLSLDIAGEVFRESAAGQDAADEVLDALAEGLTFDLQIDVETLHLVRAATSFEDEAMGSIELTMTFDGFGDPVSVEAPPSDEVTEGGDIPLP